MRTLVASGISIENAWNNVTGKPSKKIEFNKDLLGININEKQALELYKRNGKFDKIGVAIGKPEGYLIVTTKRNVLHDTAIYKNCFELSTNNEVKIFDSLSEANEYAENYIASHVDCNIRILKKRKIVSGTEKGFEYVNESKFVKELPKLKLDQRALELKEYIFVLKE